ncbi:integrator complex subunit 8-like [Mya arenaria]|uniref:integrator complex subunit 8-like n=1 Tax=Mya arenaria TaxID=6604 RepID=UPI0022E5CA06|nr:integrator complex subunit 8-like [Mya arenaria]
MTEVAPRGQMGPGPATMPAVSWYEFLLNDKLLEEHLDQEKPDPSPVQLIQQFLQEAESNAGGSDTPASSHPGALTPPLTPPISSHSTLGDPVEQNDPSRQKPVTPPLPTGESKKTRALRMLALRVAAHLHWNLNTIMKGLSVQQVHSLLTELLKVTMEMSPDAAKFTDLHFDVLTPEAIFAAQLYHRWAILTLVKHSFPTKPVKTFMTVQGQQDPVTTMLQTESLISNLREKAGVSVDNLQRCVQCGRTLRMPVLTSIPVPTELNDSPEFTWDIATEILPDEYICQLSYDLGTYFFYQESYHQALEMFRECKDLSKHMKKPEYCHVQEQRLNGYFVACRTLKESSAKLSAKPESLYRRAESARRNTYRGLVDLLIEDNVKQELSTAYRANLEDELAAKESLTFTFIQVSICNVMRGVMEGKAFVSIIADILEDADIATIKFLVKVLSVAMNGASFVQKTNLVTFLWHVAEAAPSHSHFVPMVLQSDIRNHFTGYECDQLRKLEQGTKDNMSFSTTLDDLTTVASSYPSTRDSSVTMANVEHQLMFMYDADVTRHLVSELVVNQQKTPQYVMQLNEKWRVPFEMLEIIRKTQPSVDLAYTYILIGKACHCMDVKIFERARNLLSVAEQVAVEYSYTLAKHIRWHLLLVDLQQYFLTEHLAENTNLQDLVKKVKTCITAVRLAQDIQPSPDILEHCAAFLLNVRDWGYLMNLDNTNSGHIETCRLASCLLNELPSIKNARKPARDLWDTIVMIYSTNAQHKRTSSGRDSAMYRDSQLGILPRDFFKLFLQKLREPMVLSVFISLMTKFYNILKDDITVEIYSDYLAIWPSALPNTSGVHVGAVEEHVSALMQHALQKIPSNASWLRTQADLLYANNQYSAAMKFYMEAGIVSSEFFANAVPKSIYDDTVYRKMMKCCNYLQCHTQVAVLCQFLDDVDYSAAFKALQEKHTYDAMDSYYVCIWDISILEYLVHLHSKRGEMDKRQSAMRALTQLDLNSNNPEDIIQRAVQIRKRKFLRALAKQYV